MNLTWMILFTTAVPALIPILWGVWFMRRARRSLTWPAVQAVPHAPQLARELWVSTQAAPQLVRPLPQVAAQSPRLQTSPVAHGASHPPQCAGSASVSTQAPPQF